MKGPRSNMSTVLRAYLFLGSFVLVAAAFVYSYSWVRKVNQESQTVSHLLARFVAASAVTATDNPEIKNLFTEVIRPSDLPLILTDLAGRPFVWTNIGIDSDAIDIETIGEWNPASEDPPSPVLQRILDRVEEFDGLHDSIPIYVNQHGRKVQFGSVHFGERQLAKELRYIPLVQLGVIAIFITMGYVGYRSIKTSEQRAIWIGLAKETAHQLGSPISSLMGWVELVRDKSNITEGCQDPVSLDPEFFCEVLNEMENDAERLSKIAKRFGHVGSTPQLQTVDVVPIVSTAVSYFQKRLPHLKKEIEIQEKYELAPPANVNEELIEWTVENILKNAIDATRESGVIKVEVIHRHETECVEVRITDEGMGMTSAEAKQVFTPGYTTKGRGWGLGLTLAKRIIEDYHGGNLWVDWSKPGKGSTFVISFPV
jgi:two-component system, NtrC family, sensor histidine kinase KinB